MAFLLIILGAGSFAYLWWRWTRTGLTRACRWRQDRRAGHWRCAYCGAIAPGEEEPRICKRR